MCHITTFILHCCNTTVFKSMELCSIAEKSSLPATHETHDLHFITTPCDKCQEIQRIEEELERLEAEQKDAEELARLDREIKAEEEAQGEEVQETLSGLSGDASERLQCSKSWGAYVSSFQGRGFRFRIV